MRTPFKLRRIVALCAMVAGAQASAQTFTDVAVSVGLKGGPGSWAGSWADVDGDGLLDVFTIGHLQPLTLGKNQFWRNTGAGGFVDWTTTATIISDKIDTHGVVWADFDRDGDLDLMMLNESIPGRTWLYNELWRNNGNGTFTEVGADANIIGLDHITRGLATADYDRDGLLDILGVTQDMAVYPNPPPGYIADNLLFHNDGNLKFTDVGAAAGVAMPHTAGKRTATFADYNNDGWPDLMVMADCSLFKNNANGTFTEVTDTAGILRSTQCQGAAWADYDNDGDLDVFISRGFDANTAQSLYRNNNDGTFTDVSATAGINLVQQSRGVVWGDYDNDGLVDLYIVAYKNNTVPNRLFKNNGNGTFTDVTVATGTGAQVAGNGAHGGFVDYDGDGDLDIFVTNGESTSTGPYVLLRNSGTTNNWVKFKLKGVVSNPDAIGTRLKMLTPTVTRYAAHAGPAHWMSQSNMPVHFGLGTETQVASLDLTWPNGLQQTVENIAGGQTVTLEEGSPLYAGPAALVGEGYMVSRTDNRWRIEWRGTSSTSRFTGRISALAGGTVSAVTGVGLETNDKITVATDSRSFTFAAAEDGTGSDAIEFTSAATSIRFDVKQDALSQPAKVRLGKYAVKPAVLPLTVKQ